MIQQSPTLIHALALANRGIPVFPVLHNKHPACPNGFKAASRDPSIIRRLWAEHSGPLVGVPTGGMSGIDALDIDHPRHPEAHEWLNKHTALLTLQTELHKTKSGGWHILFRHSPDLRCSTGRPVPGVDVRAEGGYIVWWPITGFQELNGGSLCDWPHDILTQVKRSMGAPLPSPAVPVIADQTVNRIEVGGPDDAKWSVRAALTEARTRVGTAREGTRNHELNRAAFTLGQYVKSGAISPDAVNALLTEAALTAGLGHSEIRATIESGLRAGMDVQPSPRPEVPPPPFAGNFGAVTLVCAADVKAEPIRWLWGGYLARGKLHILAGPAGTGKTTLALAIAAAVTTGSKLPDGTWAAKGTVLIWSGEDGLADSLKPRLMANGGDANKVFFVHCVEESHGQRPFDPATDMQKLMDSARQITDLTLVIIDPVVSAVAGDSHKNAEVRRGLQPLVDLGADLGCAIIGITHFTKGTQGRDPTERVTGSLAFGAFARLVMCTAKPTGEGAKRRLVRSKSNIGPDGGGFEYDLEQVCVEHGPPPIYGQRVSWGAVIEGTARELLQEVENDGEGGDGRSPGLNAAMDFLRLALMAGPVAAKSLKADAEGAGLSWATVRRAKDKLGVKAEKKGMETGWWWSLSSDHKPEDAHRFQKVLT